MELKYDGNKENLGTNNYVHRIKRDATSKDYGNISIVKAVCGTSVYIYGDRSQTWRQDKPEELYNEKRRPCSKCFPKLKGAYNYIPRIED